MIPAGDPEAGYYPTLEFDAVSLFGEGYISHVKIAHCGGNGNSTGENCTRNAFLEIHYQSTGENCEICLPSPPNLANPPSSFTKAIWKPAINCKETAYLIFTTP